MSQDRSETLQGQYTDRQVYPAYGYPPRPTNTMAILAMALAFSCWPLAIVFGHLARKQIARSGEDGKGWAIAGLVIGYIFLGIVVLTIITVVALIGAAAPTDPYA